MHSTNKPTAPYKSTTTINAPKNKAQIAEFKSELYPISYFAHQIQEIHNMISLPPEKLGSFYLGARYDLDNRTITSEAVNYDSRDLTTHAVCVGMTGSGKTGLCIGLLEEAAIDQVPAIIIDPKGDMTNLMLQFEQLSADEFKPWINPDDASRKGKTVDEYAQSMSELWTNGLGDWGQNRDRIALLKNAVEYTIFTPGSDSGVPINIMGSFSSPGIDFDSDSEMLRERIQGTVAALLGMVGSKEDPVRSREGILLSNLFEHYWRNNEDLDLAKLILGIQKPPMQKLGVFDMDTFFPEKDRFNLAMDFNSLIASPQFQYWLQGEDLDIDKLYFSPDGKPRHSIIYIAHLSESERMFFVTLLLNSLITWMRKQSGTTSLRSLIYFDEIFGYFPPTANPPSKKPLLTILKQARAYGVGAVLVTQNPVDIDYKGLANAGTWFIGKMQTERDKARVLDGLEGAIAEAGGKALDFNKIIPSLGSRVFLMHNVHEDSPVVYHTRWAMSYLRGPLTRPQVKQLMEGRKANRLSTSQHLAHRESSPANKQNLATESVRPSLDPSITQKYFAVWKSSTEASRELNTTSQISLAYEPNIIAVSKLRFYDQKRDVDQVVSKSLLADSPDEFGRTDWDAALPIDGWENSLLPEPDHPDNIQVSYLPIPESANSKKELGRIEKEFADWLYNSQHHTILEHEKLDLFQETGESAEAFRMRILQQIREERDEDLDELQEKYEAKFEKLNDRIRKEKQDLEEAQSEVKGRRTEEIVGMAETIFSVFVRRRSRSASSTLTKRRMRQKANKKVEESQEDLEELYDDFDDLENELKEKMESISLKWEDISKDITEKEIKPRRADVKVDHVMLAWIPYWTSDKGERVSALR